MPGIFSDAGMCISSPVHSLRPDAARGGALAGRDAGGGAAGALQEARGLPGPRPDPLALVRHHLHPPSGDLFGDSSLLARGFVVACSGTRPGPQHTSAEVARRNPRQHSYINGR